MNDVLTEAEMQIFDPWFDHFIMGKEKEKVAKDVNTIAEERAIGFTHSHNDRVNWEEIIH